MKTKKIFLTLAAMAAFTAFASQPLRRHVVRVTNEGQRVCVTRCGSEAFSWWEDVDGGRYDYDAMLGQLMPISDKTFSEKLDVVCQGTQPHGPKRSMNASTEDGLGSYGRSGEGVVASLGEPVIPVIMVAFSDKDFLPENTKEKITRFLNEEGYDDEKYAVGSVADYFRHCSYGAFRPRFEVVAKVTLPNGYKYYGGHSGSSIDVRRMETVRTAVDLAEQQGVDFSKYAKDGHAPLVSILHAGPGEQEDYGADYEDYLWAHFSQSLFNAKTVTFDSYLLTNESMRDFDKEGNVTNEYMTGIGTFCHEMGHALGLPDMYDVNGGTNGAGHTPGYWDVMDYQFMYDGYRPMEYSGYERSLMGWIEVENIVMNDLETEYILQPLATEALAGHKMYRIVNPGNAKEYLLLENRQENDFYASSFLGEGMLVWHINYDSSKWASNSVNTNAADQRVHVIPADGEWQDNQALNIRDGNGNRYKFTGDLFPGYAHVSNLNSQLDKHLESWFANDVHSIAVNNDGEVSFRIGHLQTEIENAETDAGAAVGACYDLQGRKVKGNGNKGIYIRNEKIIINK